MDTRKMRAFGVTYFDMAVRYRREAREYAKTKVLVNSSAALMGAMAVWYTDKARDAFHALLKDARVGAAGIVYGG